MSAVNLAGKDISLRQIPYPYRAMLAICSDLDNTPDQQVYFETMRYLNTTESTIMGKGMGLEVGNTIYFDMPYGNFSYWNTDHAGQAMIRELIQSGHIDCLHSYGELATSRRDVERALAELSKYNCKIEVWVDHAKAASNFGRDIMEGRGDMKGSRIYHSDLTTNYGIKYAWCGRVTSVIGQDVKRSLNGIWNHSHPISSARTLAKEWLKGLLAYTGSSKYAMHGSNQLLRETYLRSGHKIYEFMRSNPHWGGVSCGDTADGLAEVLTDQTLTRLVKRGGTSIIYTHLGKYHKPAPFKLATIKALELLTKYAKEKQILVTTTSRLLRYGAMISSLNISTAIENNNLSLELITNNGEKNLEGLTIYTKNPEKVSLNIKGHVIHDLHYNMPDHSGQTSVSIPWRPLEFPKGLS